MSVDGISRYAKHVAFKVLPKLGYGEPHNKIRNVVINIIADIGGVIAFVFLVGHYNFGSSRKLHDFQRKYACPIIINEKINPLSNSEIVDIFKSSSSEEISRTKKRIEKNEKIAAKEEIPMGCGLILCFFPSDVKRILAISDRDEAKNLFVRSFAALRTIREKCGEGSSESYFAEMFRYYLIFLNGSYDEGEALSQITDI